MAKVLHAADFHLDSVFRSLPEEQARLRRQESRELPGRLVDWANDHGDGPDAGPGPVPLSGRRGHRTGKSRLALRRQSLPPAHLAGECPHLPGPGHERLTLPELGCAVYGAAFTAPEEPESGLRGFYAQPDGSARIMVLHGDVGSREGRYRPIAPEEIASTGLDYLALGHVHAPSAMNRAGSTVWAYPGCPQGRGFDETGDRGFLFGDVEPGRVGMQFVPFARRRYEILTVDVSQGDALETIRRRLPPDTSRDIYRIRLTGETAEPLTLPALEQALSGGFFQLELADDTRLRRDLWDRCGDDTLRGLFLRRLRQEYDAADPRRQKEIEQAVRFGLAAMDNKEL